MGCCYPLSTPFHIHEWGNMIRKKFVCGPLKLLTCFNNAALWDLPNVIGPNGSNSDSGMSHFMALHTSSYIIARIKFFVCITASFSSPLMPWNHVVYFHNLSLTHTHTTSGCHKYSPEHQMWINPPLKIIAEQVFLKSSLKHICLRQCSPLYRVHWHRIGMM